MRKLVAAIFALSAALLLQACSAAPATPGATPTTPAQAPSGPKIAIQSAWARPALKGQNSAAYFVIENTGTAADSLTGAKVDGAVAKTAEVHETKMEGGVMKMQPTPRVEVPAGSKVEFKPGGYHVMIMELQHDLKEGEKISIVLTFEKSGSITVQAEVKSQS